MRRLLTLMMLILPLAVICAPIPRTLLGVTLGRSTVLQACEALDSRGYNTSIDMLSGYDDGRSIYVGSYFTYEGVQWDCAFFEYYDWADGRGTCDKIMCFTDYEEPTTLAAQFKQLYNRLKQKYHTNDPFDSDAIIRFSDDKTILELMMVNGSDGYFLSLQIENAIIL